MKKLFLSFLLLASISICSFSQNNAQYAILEFSEGQMSIGGNTIKIFYPDGTEENFGTSQNLKIVNKVGMNGLNLMKAFNYLSGKGYVYVNAAVSPFAFQGSTSFIVTNYFFKLEK